MAKSKDSIRNTLIVAISVSLVCSVLVASAAIILKPRQLLNEEEFRHRIIVDVAGFDQSEADLATLFARIEPRLVNFETGEYTNAVEVEDFDAEEAALTADLGVVIPADKDIASVRRRAIYGEVYLVKDGDTLKQIILPVKGAGLWSTLYGYLSIDADANTARGLQFYAHGETPGLGDQMDKPAWRAQVNGKQLFDSNREPRIMVIKGSVDESSATAQYELDGLAGATLTGRGITALVHYWIGDHGYGPYLDRMREEAQQSL
ncbi:MAG: Na(+)-translocating NADH-quinone reductase subunit C [Woeseiaceae bacterium]